MNMSVGKLSAIAVFIIIPFIGFYAGSTYQTAQLDRVQPVPISEPIITMPTNPLPTSSPFHSPTTVVPTMTPSSQEPNTQPDGLVSWNEAVSRIQKCDVKATSQDSTLTVTMTLQNNQKVATKEPYYDAVKEEVTKASQKCALGWSEYSDYQR